MSNIVYEELSILKIFKKNLGSIKKKILEEQKEKITELKNKELDSLDSQESIDFNINFQDAVISFKILREQFSWRLYYIIQEKNNELNYGLGPMGKGKDLEACIDFFIEEVRQLDQKTSVEDVLVELDKEEKLCKTYIYSKIRNCYPVSESYQNEKFVFGLRLVPMSLTVLDRDETQENRDRREEKEMIKAEFKYIDIDSVRYFLKRLCEVKHSLFKFFYSQVLLEIYEKKRQIFKNSDKFNFSYKDISEKNIQAGLDIFKERSHLDSKHLNLYLSFILLDLFKVSKKIRKKDLVSKVKKTLFLFLKEIEDSQIGVWQEITEALLSLQEYSEFPLSEADEICLKKDMKGRFERALRSKKHSCLESSYELLGKFYEKSKYLEKLKHYSEVYRKNLQGTVYCILEKYKELEKKYIRYRWQKELKELQEQIKKLEKERRTQSKSLLAMHSGKYKISQEQIDAHVKHVLDGTTLEKVFERLAYCFLFEKKELQKRWLSSKDVVLRLTQNAILDTEGKIIKKFHPFEKPEEYLFTNSNFILDFRFIFLRKSIEGIIQKFSLNEDKMMGYFFSSNLFDKKRAFVFKKCFQIYLSYSKKLEEFSKKGGDIDYENEIFFVPTIIPEIENLIRRFAESTGKIEVDRANKEGALTIKV